MVTGQRPFVGRSLPELTQAIISGPLRPPGVLVPDISQELEQIILTAMSRDRNQRYEQAMLMARDLRFLNLKPVEHLSPEPPARPPITPITPNESHTQPPPRPKVVIHPPKRPQMQIPRYMELEMPQPPSVEQVEALSPTSQQPDFTESPTRPTSVPEIDTEGPTGPLAPSLPIARREQRAQKARKNKAQRSFWRKIFKTSAK